VSGQSGFQGFCPVRLLPAEGGRAVQGIGVAPEMAIACRRTVDRMQKIKVADDGEWAQVEDLAHRGDDLVMRDGFRSKGVQRDRGRLRLADRIGNLKLAAAGQSGGYD